MKNILYALLIALFSFAATSCEDTTWGEEDLVETTVWVATLDSGDVYYYYPDYSIAIYESGLVLNKYTMSDWDLTIADNGDIVAVANITISDEDSQIAKHNLTYNSTYSSGTLSTQLYTDGELVSSESLPISNIAQTTKFIEK